MAVQSGWNFDLTFKAASTLAASHQYYFVTHDEATGDFYVKVATGASGPAPLGVLQNDPPNEDGYSATVRLLGVSEVMANADGSAIEAFDYITAASDGQAELATGSGIAGIALEALSSGCGIKIPVLLLGGFLSGYAHNTP
jgi:hypothetical protein